MTARREVEIRVRLPKTTGGPAEALALLADHQLATLTRSCCADREGLLLLLTTSQTEEVQQVLKAAVELDARPRAADPRRHPSGQPPPEPPGATTSTACSLPMRPLSTSSQPNRTCGMERCCVPY